jgi:hypothetical protein
MPKINPAAVTSNQPAQYSFRAGLEVPNVGLVRIGQDMTTILPKGAVLVEQERWKHVPILEDRFDLTGDGVADIEVSTEARQSTHPSNDYPRIERHFVVEKGDYLKGNFVQYIVRDSSSWPVPNSPGTIEGDGRVGELNFTERTSLDRTVDWRLCDRNGDGRADYQRERLNAVTQGLPTRTVEMFDENFDGKIDRVEITGDIEEK